jgi:uncharacterized protein YggL (DUF469 family)
MGNRMHRGPLGGMPARMGVLLAGVLVLVTAGCVKIQTSGESRERQTEVSVNQGKDVQVQFAERMQAATVGQKLAMTKTFVDSVTANYLRYGTTLVDRWRGYNQSQPQPMTDAELRKMVSNWNETQQPLTQAYENTLEYALDEIKRTATVDQQTMSLLGRFRDQYYKVYSAAFYPSGTVDEYDDKLRMLREEIERTSRDLDLAIQRYR